MGELRSIAKLPITNTIFNWSQLKTVLQDVTVVGSSSKPSRDWFDKDNVKIHELLKKNPNSYLSILASLMKIQPDLSLKLLVTLCRKMAWSQKKSGLYCP